MKTRTPKNLDDYIPAEIAAMGLEQLAQNIRRHAEERPLVKWSLNLSYWNPEWAEPDKPGPLPDVIVRQVSYKSEGEKSGQ